jgi:WD40 repeat protein
MLKILAFDQEKQMKGSLIFMIDERYVGQLERALAQQNLGWLKFDIPALDENLIADYLRQFALSFKFKEHYPILIDDRFAQTVASDLAKVDEPLGWRLHALLRLLWQRSIRKPVKWTLEAYEPIQKIGLDLKALLIQRIDDFLQSAKVQMSEDELKEELMIDLLAQLPKFEEIDVEELLKSYLQYESQLPEPWLSHREMIKFQSIWFFNQCIDAGLISGYLNLGENLPKGKIKCLHPSIYEAIQEKKNQLLKKHSYLLERFKQEIEQKIRLSHTELLEIQDLFFKQALPTLKEAEYLQKAIAENRKADAPTIIQNNAIQHQVYSDQQKKRALFFKFAPILLLIVSLSTCFSIQQKQSQIESKAKRLQVQMLLSQADEQLKQNQPHMSVALLKEIDQLQDLQTSNPIWQAQWQQTTIHTLQKPIPSKFEQISRIPQKVWFSDQGILSLYEDAKAIFYELADFKENLELTTSQWVANSDDGKQWVSIEGHELKFWTKNKQPSIKRIQSVQIKSLALNHEGTVAAILDDQGVVQLHRSYDYPMTQLKGHQQSPIVEMKVSIDGRELALLDQEGHLQKYKFNEGEQSALILVPVAENEEKFKVKAFEWVSAKTNEAQGLVVHYVLDDQQMIKYYPDRENKSQNQQGKTIYEGPSKVVAMVVSKENGRLLYALSEQQLYYEQLLNPSSTPKGIKIDLKNPTENPLKISQDGKKALMKIENKVFLIQLDPLQIRMIELLSQAVSLDQFDFSSNGQFIYATLEHEIQVWHAQLGQMAQKFAFGRSNIVGAKMYGDDLYVLLDQIGQKERTGLYHWDMNDHLQSAPLYWQQEEIESIDFIDQSAISISANHKGYLHFWNNQGDLIATAIERQKLSKVMHLNEQKLVIASFDDEIKVYPLVDQSLKEGDKILEIKAILTLKHAQSISSFTLTKNQIISADRQGLIKIWDLQGKLKGEIKASEMAIKQIEVAPQNDWFVSVAMNGKGKLWRLSEQNGQVIGQQAKELSIKIDQVKFDQQSVYISDIQGGLHQIKLQGTSLEINQLIPNQRLEDDLEEKVVSAIDLDNQKYHVQSQKYALQSYDLNGQIPMQSIALPTAQLSKIVAQKESLFLGDTDGQIWLWQSENQKQNFLQIGEHQSEIMDIKVDSQNQLLLSRSSHQAFLWKGKWDAQTLSAKLKTMPKICLKPEQRMLILGEERTQADDEYEACLNR